MVRQRAALWLDREQHRGYTERSALVKQRIALWLERERAALCLNREHLNRVRMCAYSMDATFVAL